MTIAVPDFFTYKLKCVCLSGLDSNPMFKICTKKSKTCSVYCCAGVCVKALTNRLLEEYITLYLAPEHTQGGDWGNSGLILRGKCEDIFQN